MRYLIFVLLFSTAVFAQVPAIEPGVSQELARWRAAHYSDVRYKLNLTLEKMSPVLKGTMEIRVNVSGAKSEPGAIATGPTVPIILDWRKIKGHEDKSTISNVSINGVAKNPVAIAPGSDTEHLVFRDGVKPGENVITLDFTSPILTSGSAITRYIDKEDGSEYIYSLFVPSDASTAFPVFDQPDLKARFDTCASVPNDWKIISNEANVGALEIDGTSGFAERFCIGEETKPISTYVFAFAAGPWENAELTHSEQQKWRGSDNGEDITSRIYVRKSQVAKFIPHAKEVFRLNREAVKYFEEYFDYKFPFPKYDLVLIPEFPFGGMEHAGATFLRESAIIFPQEPTKSDHISRAVLIFHEAAHQWFGDTVTMKWFDDLWLKEGFANFMAYKAVDKIMPDANAWKVFYERIKQPAYATDSTRGTTPIYQPIENLNSAKSAYGNIVYNKAPAFLKQAEFYLGQDKFQTAVRAFLKKHDYKNATWEDLVKEFALVTVIERKSGKYYESLNATDKLDYEVFENQQIEKWAEIWVTTAGLPKVRTLEKILTSKYKPSWSINSVTETSDGFVPDNFIQVASLGGNAEWKQDIEVVKAFSNGDRESEKAILGLRRGHLAKTSGNNYWDAPGRFDDTIPDADKKETRQSTFVLSNYQDYGYGIFLLDDKSREYVLKNVQNEKDAFLRSMMYGALWDSVREGELDPRTYVDVAIKNLASEQDETIAQMMTGRTATAFNYYIDKGRNPSGGEGAPQGASTPKGTLPTGRVSASIAAFESVLIERIKNAPTIGQRITFFRTLVANATTESSRSVLKAMLKGGNLSGSEGAPQGSSAPKGTLPTGRVSAFVIRAKDKFDIVTRLAVLNDPDAASLLAELEKTETSDDAKRYAYAARAAFPTKENREKFWNDFVANKDISESWIEAAVGPFNSVRNSELSLPYLERALKELPNLKRSRKIFFVNNWLGAFIGGQRSEEALNIVNKFLADNPNLDKDLRLKLSENVDIVERAVKIRAKYGSN